MISGRTIDLAIMDELQPYQKEILMSVEPTGPHSMKHYALNWTPTKGVGSGKWNPLFVQKDAQKEDPASYWSRDGKPRTGVAYVLYKVNETRDFPTRMMTASSPIRELRLGICIWLSDGPAHGNLGQYVVVGCVDYTAKEKVGTVPHRYIASCTT